MLPGLAKVQVLQETHWPPASPARLVAWSGGQGHLPTGQLAPEPGPARVGTVLRWVNCQMGRRHSQGSGESRGEASRSGANAAVMTTR